MESSIYRPYKTCVIEGFINYGFYKMFIKTSNFDSTVPKQDITKINIRNELLNYV